MCADQASRPGDADARRAARRGAGRMAVYVSLAVLLVAVLFFHPRLQAEYCYWRWTRAANDVERAQWFQRLIHLRPLRERASLMACVGRFRDERREAWRLKERKRLGPTWSLTVSATQPEEFSTPRVYRCLPAQTFFRFSLSARWRKDIARMPNGRILRQVGGSSTGPRVVMVDKPSRTCRDVSTTELLIRALQATDTPMPPDDVLKELIFLCHRTPRSLVQVERRPAKRIVSTRCARGCHHTRYTIGLDASDRIIHLQVDDLSVPITPNANRKTPP